MGEGEFVLSCYENMQLERGREEKGRGRICLFMLGKDAVRKMRRKGEREFVLSCPAIIGICLITRPEAT